MILGIIGAAVQILDILIKRNAKDPATAPQFAPITTTLIGIVSQAAEETPQETAKRMADHDALIAQYAGGPPPGAKLP